MPILPSILIDHAHCEKKAAGTALNLIFAYVENIELCREMTEIVNEELEHFHMVLDLLGPARHPLPPADAVDLRPRAERPGAQAGAAAGRRSAARGRADRGPLVRAVPRAGRARAGRASWPSSIARCSNPKPGTTRPTRGWPKISRRKTPSWPGSTSWPPPKPRSSTAAKNCRACIAEERGASCEERRSRNAAPRVFASRSSPAPTRSQYPGPRRSISPSGHGFAAG